MAASVQNPGCLPDKEYTGQWYFPTVKAEAGSGERHRSFNASFIKTRSGIGISIKLQKDNKTIHRLPLTYSCNIGESVSSHSAVRKMKLISAYSDVLDNQKLRFFSHIIKKTRMMSSSSSRITVIMIPAFSCKI